MTKDYLLFFVPSLSSGLWSFYLLFNEDDTMITKGGLVVKKQEMTRLWIDGKQVPVTLLKIVPQEIIRYKTQEKDGYDALVLGVEKIHKDNKKVKYKKVYEFKVDSSFSDAYKAGSVLDASLMSDVKHVRVFGISKGKGFQGVMKRHNFAGGPESHGSKFHRAGGSTGMRKPRRTIRGWKMAGRMGGDSITLRSVPLVDIWEHDGNTFVVLKGSIPGAYNSYVKLIIQ